MDRLRQAIKEAMVFTQSEGTDLVEGTYFKAVAQDKLVDDKPTVVISIAGKPTISYVGSTNKQSLTKLVKQMDELVTEYLTTMAKGG